MDVLMCNGVHLEEPHTVSAQPGAADGHLKHDQAEPTSRDGHAATAAVAGAGPHTSSIANHSSNSDHASSINIASLHAPGWKRAVPAATQQQPTAVSLLAGSISPQAAEPVPPAALPIALTASTFAQTGLTQSYNSTTKAGAAASAGRCADWHAMLLGTGAALDNHQQAPEQPAATADDAPEQQTTGSASEVMQEAHMQHAAGARQQRGAQQLASFDLMFLQGGLA
uniref:Uncharacterized protein n=1 Tax=Tetradesmus obliquus TaxID=3088 RepID=A0A383W5B9_TETOB